MKPKEPRISVRVDPELKARIESISKHTGIDEATLVRNCIEALCNHVDKMGSITFPMEISPAKKPVSAVVRTINPAQLNEPPGSYRKTKLGKS